MNIIDFSKPTTGNIFADLILWLVTVTSSVAAGVILFTLFLKLITLPFDFMSRFSMRKNSIKMEQMRPELEKLQKQYAGNKELYNQKMMALYKKNGYSMFGACLPTIITLVIFIIAINGFNAYSRYQNKQYFYEMSVAYNNVLYAGMEIDREYIAVNEDGEIYVDDDKIIGKINAGELEITTSKGFNIIITGSAENFSVETSGGYIKYIKSNTSTNPDFEITDLTKDVINGEYNHRLKNADGDSFTDAKAKNPELTEKDFLSSVASYMAAETFRNNGSRFLWVKNIWVTDSPSKHPVENDWSTFQKNYGYDITQEKNIGDDGYGLLIAGLTEEQTAPNGYFILVALTAISSLLMQFILGKSQKAQMELQTVDGQGAQTQKMMMWMMPVMMAVFAFMYTAAFSLYIVISSLFSLATTLLINLLADRKYKPKEGEDEVIRGRVFIPPTKEEPSSAKNKKKKDKTAEDGFLSGLADKKKHSRGRIK